ncbi:MAG: radical SAM family heme chaperone HemW [Myxococcales bacterium]|nr:radical SAM family heme chaperone HemW [Myxococcales bacterium]
MSGLYVHVPFCARACPYCDFDFEVGRRPDVDAFIAGLDAELARRPEVGGRRFSTIYVGGGTPSLLGAAGLAALFAWLKRHFSQSGGRERTVELNPEHCDEALFDELVDAGVDRISLGIQTFDPAGLRQLGRVHEPDEASAAIVAARRRGLRVSGDLIVGWPGQTAASLRRDVARMVDAGVGHVSVYALTIEAGTPWPKLVRRGLRVLPDADAQAEMLALAERTLSAAGLRHYEVASYTREGEASRHNLLYWTWQDYVGLGPSAASAIYAADGAVTRRSNPRGLAAWLAGEAAEIERLDPEEAAREGLWIGLRVLDGIDVAAYRRVFPGVTQAWLDARIAAPLARGNLEWTDEGRGLRVAPGRWLWHDDIGASILA